MSRTIDMVGKRFGKLVVLRKAERPMNHHTAWVCRCDCGTVWTTTGARIRSGETTTCGCGTLEAAARARRIDLTGARFGRLTVLSEDGRRGGYIAWACRCDCGTHVTVRGNNLRSGTTVSCGCRKKSVSQTHGGSGTGAYVSWAAMRTRCTDQKSDHWEHYGGRGITVCERWQSFENFYADMGDRPSGKTIDRIDVNGNYEPGNCRWATTTEQARNKRKVSEEPIAGGWMSRAEAEQIVFSMMSPPDGKEG